MLSFLETQRLLSESKVQNKHLDHLEDMMFLSGAKGLAGSIAFLKDIAKSLKAGKAPASMKFSTKWDGKPAVVCGINPENKKFFVATKGAFSKTVKAYHTPAEVRKGVQSADLGNKLIACLQLLPKLGIKGVLQGDLMFTGSDKKQRTINGVNYITFQPNTIMYAVGADSELGRRIQAAKLGIAFHTQYSGETMAGLNATSFNFNSSGLKKSADVWYTDPNIYDITPALLNDDEYNNLIKMIADAEGQSKKAGSFLKTLVTKSNEEMLKMFILPYINATIAGGLTNFTVQGLILHIESKYNKEIDKLKTEKGKMSRENDKKKMVNFVKTYSEQFTNLFTLHNKLAKCKEILLAKFNNIGAFGHFFVDEDGIRPTDPEGIVVSRTGGVIKLVNRLKFSRQNRKVNA